MRLIFKSEPSIGRFVITDDTNVYREIPVEFEKAHQDEIQYYLSLQEEQKRLAEKSKGLLVKLKSDFDTEIRVLHPEFFL